MPSLFDAAAGAGQAALGAQAYRAGELDNQGRALDNQGQDVRNRAAQEALARAIKEANDDEQMRATWAKALSEVLSLRDAQAPPPGSPEAEVDAFYAGQDDPTKAAKQRLRPMIESVARIDKNAALELGQEFLGAINEREQEGALRRVQKSAATAITGLQEMSAEGFLPEATAQQFTERIQEVLEALDEDPAMLAQGMKALQAIRAEATRAYLEGAEKANVKAEIQGLVDRLPPNMKKWGAVAAVQVANGGDANRALAGLAEKVYGTADPDPEVELKRPGVFEESPPWVQARIDGEATNDTLTYLAKLKLTDKFGNERGMTPQEIQAALPEWKPLFLQQTMARHNKTSAPRAPSAPSALTPMSVGGRQVQPMAKGRPGGAIGAPDQQAALEQVVNAPAPAAAKGAPRSGARPPLRQGSGPSTRVDSAGDKVVRGRGRKQEPVTVERKRGKNESPQEYLEYVQRVVSQKGGGPEDVARALEAAGLTPDDFKGAKGQ